MSRFKACIKLSSCGYKAKSFSKLLEKLLENTEEIWESVEADHEDGYSCDVKIMYWTLKGWKKYCDIHLSQSDTGIKIFIDNLIEGENK